MNDAHHKSEIQVSVVVLTCGDPETTKACLESIALSDGPPLQLVVVDNGGGTVMQQAMKTFQRSTAATRLADFTIINNVSNIGACSGRNQALQKVVGQYVAFVDNDINVRDAKWIQRLTAFLESNDQVGIVGPRIVNESSNRLECAGYAVNVRGSVIPLGQGALMDDPMYRTRRVVQAVGNFIAPTEIIRRVGGFDRAFDPFGFENIDCCYRVKQLNKSIVCDGRTDLYHIGHVTTGRFEHRGRKMLFEKSLLLRKKWHAIFVQEAEFCARLTAAEITDGDEGVAV